MAATGKTNSKTKSPPSATAKPLSQPRAPPPHQANANKAPGPARNGPKKQNGDRGDNRGEIDNWPSRTGLTEGDGKRGHGSDRGKKTALGSKGKRTPVAEIENVRRLRGLSTVFRKFREVWERENPYYLSQRDTFL